MATHKHIDRICAAAVVLSLLTTLLFMNGSALGIQAAAQVMGYENRLFDTARVHTIDIVMDGWDSFLDTCENEEYAACSVVVDGEAYKNVGLRAKGNTSLSTVSRLGSDRYSFKIEFDRYDTGRTYYGLDKLCLNNLIQDNTMMKDYLTYRLMASFGVSAPLCSYVWITVNGQDWGLYLAIEGVEDGFLQRNYGQDRGQLYKPDSMSFGGGRGNGRNFDMDGFMNRDGGAQQENQDGGGQQGQNGAQLPDGQQQTSFPGGMQSPGGQQQTSFPGGMQPPGGRESGQTGFDPAFFGGVAPGAGGENALPEGFDPAALFGGEAGDRSTGGNGFGGMFGGMGSGDVKLQYSDDDPDSYANIFDNAKTDVSQADQARLIQALKTLGEGGDVSEAVDIDQVLRYFVVHNFVVNGDSYTGSMVHNYYLHEKDGRLSMIPWDYNLAFGTFQGGSASGAVNDPVDTPLSVTGSGDRPMADWICSSQEYTQLYHRYFREFLDGADCAALIGEARTLIAPYVERDPTKFCTYEEFEAGTAALETFCALRIRSVAGQLDGTIPSTDAGQSADPSALVDASVLTLSDMGTMGNGADRGGFGWGQNGEAAPALGTDAAGGETDPQPSAEAGTAPDRPAFWNGQRPEGVEAGNLGGFPGGAPGGQTAGGGANQSVTSLVLLGISALVLLAGLLIAFKFKR